MLSKKLGTFYHSYCNNDFTVHFYLNVKEELKIRVLSRLIVNHSCSKSNATIHFSLPHNRSGLIYRIVKSISSNTLTEMAILVRM